jgi:hypothetical protein
MNPTKNSREHTTNMDTMDRSSHPCELSVLSRGANKTEKCKSTSHIHPWISQLVEWIETIFGEDVKRP